MLKEDENENETMFKISTFKKENEPSKIKKVIAFDLDHTLVKPKGKTVFPKNKDDWKFLRTDIPENLQNRVKDGYVIVIFTNQASSKFNKDEFIEKIEKISKKLKVPLICYVSTDYDIFRKPAPGMWYSFIEEYGPFKESMYKESMYIGDAAGREKDFSDSDYKFALNIGILFQTPEEYFNGEKDEDYEKEYSKSEHPITKYSLKKGSKKNVKLTASSEQEIIIMVGPPASGKSTTASKKIFKDYEIISQDDLGTKAKVLKAIDKSLKSGKSVIVDRKNEYVDSRKDIYKLADKYDIPIRIFFFNYPKELVEHLDRYRYIKTGKKIPKIVYNKYYSEKKGLEKPSKEESEMIKTIIEIPFKVKKTDDELFMQYLI